MLNLRGVAFPDVTCVVMSRGGACAVSHKLARASPAWRCILWHYLRGDVVLETAAIRVLHLHGYRIFALHVLNILKHNLDTTLLLYTLLQTMINIQREADTKQTSSGHDRYNITVAFFLVSCQAHGVFL